jgi:GNAT superfamily N-acetyltransferase
VFHDRDRVTLDDQTRVLEADPLGHADLLRSFYDEILVEAFSPDELGEPWWELGSGTSARTLLAMGPSDDVLGGVVSELFPESRVLLISWLAVRSGLRGKGIGSLLMRSAADRWYGHPGQQLVVGEIDDPRHWPSEAQDPVLRLRFYDRVGALALARPYFQPAVGPGHAPVYHMFLASFDSTAPGVLPGGLTDGVVVRRFITEYLKVSSEAGGISAPVDDDYKWLLSFYDGADIPLVPLLEYETFADPDPPSQARRGHDC